MARSARCVLETGPQAVGVADLKGRLRQEQWLSITSGFPVRPRGFEFVVSAPNLVGRIVRETHFSHTPFHRTKRRAVRRTKRGHRETTLPRSGYRRAIGDAFFPRLVRQVPKSVTQRVTVVGLIVFLGSRICREIEQVSAKTRKISGCETSFPTSAKVVGGCVLPEVQIVAVFAWVEIPVNSIQFRPVTIKPTRLDGARKLVDELPNLATSGCGVGAEKVQNLAGAVGVFTFERRDVQAAVRVDDSRLVVPRNKHHVEIPRDGCPVPIWVVVVSVVAIWP